MCPSLSSSLSCPVVFHDTAACSFSCVAVSNMGHACHCVCCFPPSPSHGIILNGTTTEHQDIRDSHPVSKHNHMDGIRSNHADCNMSIAVAQPFEGLQALTCSGAKGTVYVTGATCDVCMQVIGFDVSQPMSVLCIASSSDACSLSLLPVAQLITDNKPRHFSKPDGSSPLVCQYLESYHVQ